MLRPSSFACILGAALIFSAGACSKPPTSPTGAGGASSPSQSEAKPGGGGGTPSPSLHQLSFGPATEHDGYPSPGHVSGSGPVQGWITGPNTSGFFKVSAAGAFTLSLSDVDELPDDAAGGDPCTEQEQDYLRSIGLVAAPVSGSLTLTIGEDTTGSVQGPTMAWELGGILVEPGYTWKITGASGSTNPLFKPVFEPGSTNTNLTVTLENGRAHFTRYPNGGGKPRSDRFIACRTDFTMVMTKQ